VMEYDIHTFLDLLTLGATCWVEYMMRVPLKSTYSDELDTIETHHVVRGRSQTYGGENASCSSSFPHNGGRHRVLHAASFQLLLPLTLTVSRELLTDVALLGAGAACASGNNA
jgi:hypothetical protein